MHKNKLNNKKVPGGQFGYHRLELEPKMIVKVKVASYVTFLLSRILRFMRSPKRQSLDLSTIFNNPFPKTSLKVKNCIYLLSTTILTLNREIAIVQVFIKTLEQALIF